MARALTAVVAVLLLGAAGCATFVNGSTQPVNIKTDPPGAICEVREASLAAPDAGTLVASIVTPGIVVLKRSEEYRVACTVAGHKAATSEINQVVGDNFGYLIVGNLFFGLVPGLVVDFNMGAAYRLVPAILKIPMEAGAATQPTTARVP